MSKPRSPHLVQSDAAVARLKSGAAPPEEVSREVPAAPARGPMQVYYPSITVRTENGLRVRREPMPAGRPAKVASALDLIEARSRRGRDAPPLFDNACHTAAAEFEALWHKVYGGFVKCSNLDAVGGAGSGFDMDGAADKIARLRAMCAAIGRGPVLAPKVGGGREAVLAIDLVVWMLIRRPDRGFAAVLARHGWSDRPSHRRALEAGLRDALGRAYEI